MPTPNEWVRSNCQQDPKSERWVYPAYEDGLLAYFADTPRGTPVVARVIHGHLPPQPEDHPDNDPRTEPGYSRYKRLVFWAIAWRRIPEVQDHAGDFPVYRRVAVLRKDMDSPRDLVASEWSGCAREDDTERVARLFSDQRTIEDRRQVEREAETQRRASQEAAWQARQAEKLRADKLKAERLGLSLEEYLVGLATLRQMRHATKPGCCLICKRPLSLSTSVKRGVGPECHSRLTVAERISAAAETVARVVGGEVA